MGNTITQLVSKMLFSEHLLQRIAISKSIFKLLQTSAYKSAGFAKVIKSHFETRLKACALHPLGSHRQSVCEIAKFFDAHAEESDEIKKAA